MTFCEYKTNFNEDWLRVCRTRGLSRIGGWKSILLLFVNEGLIVLCTFRLGTYLKTKSNFFAKILLFIVSAFHIINCRITGIQLPIGTKVGKGLMFNHYSCIVIAGSVEIGEYCTVFQGVTIGRTWTDTAPPRIGNNCILSPGCKVIGNVCLGNRVIVGANAVVTKDVPDDSVVVGVPAKIISTNSKQCIKGKWQNWMPM